MKKFIPHNRAPLVMQKHHNKTVMHLRGFSLIEMLMALLVASLLMAALAPVMIKKAKDNVSLTGEVNAPKLKRHEINFNDENCKTINSTNNTCEGQFVIPNGYNGSLYITATGGGGGGGSSVTTGSIEYTTAGTFDFVVPAGVTELEVTLVSGGAGGGAGGQSQDSMTYVISGTGNETNSSKRTLLSTGNGNWSVPERILSSIVKVTACGGGGGGTSVAYRGSDTYPAVHYGAGGGSGAYVVSSNITVTPSSSVGIMLGGGGAAPTGTGLFGAGGGGGTSNSVNSSGGCNGGAPTSGSAYGLCTTGQGGPGAFGGVGSCSAAVSGSGGNGTTGVCSGAGITGAGGVGGTSPDGAGNGGAGGSTYWYSPLGTGGGGGAGVAAGYGGGAASGGHSPGGGGGGAATIFGSRTSRLLVASGGGGAGGGACATSDINVYGGGGGGGGGGTGGGNGGRAGGKTEGTALAGAGGSPNGISGTNGVSAAGGIVSTIFGTGYCNGGDQGVAGLPGAMKLQWYIPGSGGSGGGSGGISPRQIINVTPGETLKVTVGAGGTGGPAGNLSTAGVLTNPTTGGLGGVSDLRRGVTLLLSTCYAGAGGCGNYGGSPTGQVTPYVTSANVLGNNHYAAMSGSINNGWPMAAGYGGATSAQASGFSVTNGRAAGNIVDSGNKAYNDATVGGDGGRTSLFGSTSHCTPGAGGALASSTGKDATGYGGCAGGGGYGLNPGGKGVQGYVKITWNPKKMGTGGGGGSANCINKYKIDAKSGSVVKYQIGAGGTGGYLYNGALISGVYGGDTIFGLSAPSAYGIIAGGGYGGGKPIVSGNFPNVVIANGLAGSKADICRIEGINLLICSNNELGLQGTDAGGGDGASSKFGSGGNGSTMGDGENAPKDNNGAGGGGAGVFDLGTTTSPLQNPSKGGKGAPGKIILEWYE